MDSEQDFNVTKALADLTKRQKYTRITRTAALAVTGALFLNVLVINYVFYPDCSKATRDCFVIQKAWADDNI